MTETNVEIDRDQMEQLRNETRAELVQTFHKQKILARAARKAGNPAQGAVHTLQADYLYKMIAALDVPPSDDPYSDLNTTRIQEAIG